MASVTDDFNRAGPTTGAGYSVPTGSFACRIVGSVRVEMASTADPSSEYNNTITPGADQYSQVALVSQLETNTTDASYGVGPATRMATGDTRRYYVRCRTNSIQLYRVDSVGAHTALGAAVTTVALTDTIRIESSGTGHRVLKNGVQIIAPQTDATLATGRIGYAGCLANVSPALDDLDAGDLSAASGADTTAYQPWRSIGEWRGGVGGGPSARAITLQRGERG